MAAAAALFLPLEYRESILAAAVPGCGTAENMMCHYAILDASGGGEATTWLEPITDEQYLATHRTAGV